MFLTVRWVGLALALTFAVAACGDADEESPTEAEIDSAVMTPTVGGLYGSDLTYACTNQPGSYCYGPTFGSPIVSTASAVQPFLDSAARNWGCDWNFGFNFPSQRPTSAWVKWYGTQADNARGCGVAWWNPKKQAAYFMGNGATSIQGYERSGNVALASRGASVSVSSTYSSATPASAIIDGNRRGNPWGAGGGWSSRYLAGYPTAAAPEWIEITFPSDKQLSEIAVSTLQDNATYPVEPYINQTFSKYGIRDFTVSYWYLGAWKVIATANSNNQVYRRLTFNPITTRKIRVTITAALDSAARVTEVEAYETGLVSKKLYEKYLGRDLDTGALGMPISNPIPTDAAYTSSQVFENGIIHYYRGNADAWVVMNGDGTESNVALAQNGGFASSSGEYAPSPASSINDGQRWNKYWASSTSSSGYSCNYGNWWTRVNFIAPREISEIDLISLQDDMYGQEPTSSTLTSKYGNVDFHLQYCPAGTTCGADGSGWAEPPGGYITGNNKAVNTVTFAPVQATAVRAMLDCVQGNGAHAYVVELEAWHRAPAPPVNTALPTWTTTSLFAARDNHTATLLSSGKVLVAGGAGTNGSAVAAAELYDPSTGTWGSGGSLTTARVHHTATVLPSGKVLVAGGATAESSWTNHATAELYDPSTNTWTPTGSLATARRKHTATLLPSGKVLVAGGVTETWDGMLSTAELYDPATGSWTSAGSLKGRRYGHTATLLQSGKVLVTGGFGPLADSKAAYLPTAELYDPQTNTWSSTGNLAQARQTATATLLTSGKVLVVGGLGPSQPLDSAEIYDPIAETWSSAGWLTTSRVYHTATLLPSGKVLVAGGRGPSGAVSITTLSSTELYDPDTNKWTAGVALPSPRNSHTATLLVSGSLLAVGGMNNGVTLGTATLFGAPPAATDVESKIEVGYANPQLHTVTKSPVVFSRGMDQVMVWDRKFDGVDMLTDARSAQLPDGSWTTRFLRELSAPVPVNHAAVWSFEQAAQSVGLDPTKVHARLVYVPDLEQSQSVPNPTNAAEVELVVKKYDLAIELVDDDTNQITYVDAYTGAYIQEVSQEMDVAAQTFNYGTVDLDLTPGSASSWILRDPNRSSTFNGQGVVSVRPPDYPTDPLVTYLPLQPTKDYANDVAFGLQQSWDYFHTKFGRRGLRDQPAGFGFANDAIAYFEPGTDINVGMTVATGYIRVYQDPNSIWKKLLTADVIGHEWTHAVWAHDTAHRSMWFRRGSNGGINEANSDLFGELIEARAKATLNPFADPDAITDGWILGQDYIQRNMCDPSQSRDKNIRSVWSADFELSTLGGIDPHYTMGPLDRVFCLLGRGMLQDVAGNDPVLRSPIAPEGFAPLGAATVGTLAYRAMMYLRGYPIPATYYAQRESMLRAATALFGEYSPEYKAIQDAFAVVKVGAPADRVKPFITLTSSAVVSPSQPISVGVAAANPIKTVTFQLDGAGVAVMTTPAWQVSAPNKPPGQHTLRVTAVDSHRNTSTTDFVLTFKDTTVPESCDIAIGPAGIPAGAITVILSGRDDISGLSGLDLYQNGVLLKNDYTPSAPGVARSVVLTTTLAPGTYVFKGMCGDKSGNIATVSRTHTVGSTTPPCNTTAVAGENTIDIRTFDMGKTSGTVTLLFQTFIVEDRIRVYYQNNMIVDTGCVSTGYPTPAWAQTVQYSGSSSQLTVRVDPNCGTGTDTKWNYKLSCP